MNNSDDCPAKIVLAEFMDGHLLDPALTQIAEHIESCTICQGAVNTLAPQDTLVESLRGRAPEAEKNSGVVPRSLLEKLSQIPNAEPIRGQLPGLFGRERIEVEDVEARPRKVVIDPNEEQRLGHYRLVEVLGSGGMGEVFRAEDTNLNRPVALKVMLPRIAESPNAKERFLREARPAASVISDHIVTVHQVGEENGLPFIATELLRGQSLAHALQDDRKFSIIEILKIAREVSLGLAAAHAKGLVHRDIKPANLWLEQTSKNTFRMKILDFGLARAELDESQLTLASAIVGTPAFMAPEQARGSKSVDFRSDLFSLGCVLYLLCAHELPFQAETTIETLIAIALTTPRSPELIQPGTPPELARLVMDLLEKDPKKRPESADQVIERLN